MVIYNGLQISFEGRVGDWERRTDVKMHSREREGTEEKENKRYMTGDGRVERGIMEHGKDVTSTYD